MTRKSAVLNGKPDAGNPHVAPTLCYGMRVFLAGLSCVAALLSGEIFADDVATPIAQSVDLVVDVDASKTNTYSGAITLTGGAKLVKKGAGMLILSNGANSFDGGISLEKGTLQADAEGAFGSQRISLDTTERRLLVFNAANATFPNEIVQTAAGSYGWNQCHLSVLKSTHLAGGVDTKAGSFVFSALADKTASLIIDGAVDAGENSIETEVKSSIVFNGSVTCGTFRAGRGWSSSGEVHFNNAVNHIRQIKQDATDVHSGQDGSLDDIEFYMNSRWSSDSKSGYKLAGKSHTILCMDANPNLEVDKNASVYGGSIRSTSEATLTITGGVTMAGNTTATCRYYIGQDTEKINLVLDAPNFTQVFSERGGSGSYANRTTGTIGVSNGTFKVSDKVQFANVPGIAVARGGELASAVTNGVTFGSCTTLRVDGKLTVEDGTLFPFTQKAVSLELGEDAEVRMPAGMVFKVKSLKIGGVEMNAGLYSSGPVKSGAVALAGVSATWTGAGGVDTAIASAANWGGALPDILFGSAVLRFATGGSVATVGAAQQFGDVTLDAADGFTFAKAGDAASIKVNGTLSVAKSAADAAAERCYAFETPVTLKAEAVSLAQQLNVPTNDTVVFAGGLDVTGNSSATLTKGGEGTLELGNGSVIEGRILHTNGKVRVTGTLATPGHVDQGDASPSSQSSSFYMPSYDYGNRPTLELNGATIEKPFYGHRATELFSTVSNTVNVFKGKFVMKVPAANLPATGPEGELWFLGGFDCSWSCSATGGGTVHICDYVTETVTRTNSIRAINAGPGTHLIFEGVLNNFSDGIYFSSEKALVEFKKSYATVDPMPILYMGNQYGAASATNTLYLGSTTQQVARLAHNNPEGRTRGEIILGEPGSLLEVTDGGTNVVNWAGAVALKKSGDGELLMRYRACSTTGGIEVTGGILRFADDASCPSATNVTVAGTGKLAVSQRNTFNRKLALALDGSGVISVAAGATVRVAKLTVDGEEVACGRYTYANAPAALKAHLDPEAEGEVVVAGGLTMIFR